MVTIRIRIEKTKIVATPSCYDKRIKQQFAAFGGAQKPFDWNGTSWVIDGEDRVSYWSDRVKKMFDTWKENPCEVIDAR